MKVRFALGRRQRHGQNRGGRWPGWGNLLQPVGGHPGGICTQALELALVRPDGLAVNARHTGNLMLGLAQTQQGKDGGLFVRLQDVHSVTSPSGKVGLRPAKQRPTTPALNPVPDQFRWGSLKWPRMGEFGWPSGIRVNSQVWFVGEK